ncbi:hypothetical protein [Moorella sp. ACPs]|uniref:hypothetical protein n=1 Tax=Neomoorella carbonis TaxID=3062783 RepID=UPI003255C06D
MPLRNERYAEERVIEQAVETALELARPQVNPYKWLYHNPSGVQTMQWFAHWTQRYTGHRLYKAIQRIAKITGYELVPASLFYRHTAPWAARRVKIYGRSFILIKREEMTPGLARRYDAFCRDLQAALKEYRDELEDDEDISPNVCV